MDVHFLGFLQVPSVAPSEFPRGEAEEQKILFQRDYRGQTSGPPGEGREGREG